VTRDYGLIGSAFQEVKRESLLGPLGARLDRQPQGPQRIQQAAFRRFDAAPGRIVRRIRQIRDDFRKRAGFAEFADAIHFDQPVARVLFDRVAALTIAAGVVIAQRDFMDSGLPFQGAAQGDHSRQVRNVTHGGTAAHAAAVLEIQGLLALVAGEELHGANMRPDAPAVEREMSSGE
jgi:hypothetical protein